MPNTIDHDPFFRYKIDNYSGGSVFGEPEYEDGLVAMTEFGEFAVDLGWEGDLYVDFPSIGLSCSYDDQGGLETASLDMETVLTRLGFGSGSPDSKLNLWMIRVARLLKDNDMMMVLTINVQKDTVEVMTLDKNQDISRDKSDGHNFVTGVSAQIEVGKETIPFIVEKRGGELGIGIAKDEKRQAGYDMLIVSSYVKFDEKVMALKPREYQKLARNILLN